MAGGGCVPVLFLVANQGRYRLGSVVGQLKLAGEKRISLKIGLDHYLEIRGGTCGKVDSFGGAGALIEGTSD